MLSVWAQLSEQLQAREQAQLKRQRAVVTSPAGVWQRVNGETLRNFCSNDYLGLANHPKLIETAQKACAEYGTGSGASHLVSGHSHWHHQLEETFAERTGRSRALLFSTGYMANLGVITALLGKQDAVFEDKWNHASLLDGGLLSGARFQRFLHNDMDSLRNKLQNTQARRKLICVDGVFSMDGDVAPMDQLATLAAENDALLMVDDAHGLGVLGANGLGVCDHFGLTQEQVPVLMCTLGKAMGSFGAIVAGSDVLIDSLIQFARPYIYTTALPPSVAATTVTALNLISEEAWRRDHLRELVSYFRHEAALLNLPLMNASTAIQPLLIGDDGLALQWQAKLREAGFWISAIRPPTVPAGTARLRITFTAAHQREDVDALLQALKAVQQQMDVA